MSWYDELPAGERAELRDAGRIGATRYQGPELIDVGTDEGKAELLDVMLTPIYLDPVEGPELEPCDNEPHDPHWDEYGTCPGVKEVEA